MGKTLGTLSVEAEFALRLVWVRRKIANKEPRFLRCIYYVSRNFLLY